MAKKKVAAQEEVVQETPAQEEVVEQPNAELSIQDLIAVRNIIDIASQRGAFKAAEMEPVGKAFNKLHTFLEAVAPKQEEEASEE